MRPLEIFEIFAFMECVCCRKRERGWNNIFQGKCEVSVHFFHSHFLTFGQHFFHSNCTFSNDECFPYEGGLFSGVALLLTTFCRVKFLKDFFHCPGFSFHWILKWRSAKVRILILVYQWWNKRCLNCAKLDLHIIYLSFLENFLIFFHFVGCVQAIIIWQVEENKMDCKCVCNVLISP
jgi:hypothetical protein